MYLARFSTTTGPASLPIDRATVIKGFRMHGFNSLAALTAMNNLSRGVPVIIGECVIERIDPKNPRWN